VTRLLSSYLHLFKAPEAIERYKTFLEQRNKSTTWDDFWQSAISGMGNPHWDPQINFCGLKKFWPFFNFVGNFELIQEHGPQLTKILPISQYSKSSLSPFTPLDYLQLRMDGLVRQSSNICWGKRLQIELRRS
jgi:hypothetical protein